MKLFNKAFLTGCDSNHEWILPWFFKNYKQHNNTPIIFADFGVSAEALEFVKQNVDDVIDLKQEKVQKWFKKPAAMLNSPSEKTVWIDTDCQVLADISNVFDLLTPNTLSMCEDKPWISRRKELWHNSGVVGFIGKPHILQTWAKAIKQNPAVGDQEVLHSLLNPITKITYINTLPNEYNWLRLQLQDGQDSPNKKVMHWTGPKGKDIIRSMMNA